MFDVRVSMLFKNLEKIKIEIEGRLYCIDIYDDDCTSAQFRSFLLFLKSGPRTLQS